MIDQPLDDAGPLCSPAPLDERLVLLRISRSTTRPSQPAGLRLDGRRAQGLAINSTVTPRTLPCRSTTTPTWTSASMSSDRRVRHGRLVGQGEPSFLGTPGRPQPARRLIRPSTIRIGPSRKPAAGAPRQRRPRLAGRRRSRSPTRSAIAASGRVGADEAGHEVGRRGARISNGGANWASRPPSCMTATRSPSLIASSMSWVTKRIVLASYPGGAEFVLEALTDDRIDGAEGLVHEHDRRVGGERSGDADALALAAANWAG